MERLGVTTVLKKLRTWVLTLWLNHLDNVRKKLERKPGRYHGWRVWFALRGGPLLPGKLIHLLNGYGRTAAIRTEPDKTYRLGLDLRSDLVREYWVDAEPDYNRSLWIGVKHGDLLPGLITDSELQIKVKLLWSRLQRDEALKPNQDPV